MRLDFQRRLLFLWALFWGAQVASAAVVAVVQRSSPAGIVSQSTMVTTPTNFTTVSAPMSSTSYRFTHWTINGTRTNDFSGRALNPVRFDVYEAIDAVANYQTATNDTDADGISDWYEIHFYGDLAQTDDSDTDGDGLTLAQEYQWDLHPGLSNSFLSGGVSMRDSELVLVNLAQYCDWTISSEPAGLIATQSGLTPTGTVIVTESLGPEISGYTFGHWTLNGMRQADETGMALSRLSFTVATNMAAVAQYFPTSQDTDGDGLPDWWEYRYFGNSDPSADADPDGDGLTLAEEYRYESNPVVSNSFISGGVSMRNSEPTLVNLAGFFDWSISSDPAGLIPAQTGVAQTGTVFSTASLGDSIAGYEFGYWSLNGARQADVFGVALSRISFEVTTDINAVAHFFLAGGDADANGIPDWWEYRNFGSTGQNPNAAIPGEGTVGDAYRYGYSPVLSNSFLSGGVSMCNSEMAAVNLQPFERVEYALEDGVLQRFFTVWPTNTEVSGMDFGDDTAPGVGDWDGDGDFDLFVGASGGVMRVYENIGSEYTLDLTARTTAFDGLSSGWSGISHPYPALGDWDGDGRADLAIGGDAGRIRLLSSPGNFSNPQTPATSYDLTIADTTIALPSFAEMTGDANLDLLVLTADGTVRVFANSGNPAAPFGGEPVESNLLGAAVAAGSGLSMRDINGDDGCDALASDAEGRIWEFYRTATSNFALQSKVWGGSGPGFARRLTIGAADLDGDGDTDAFLGYDHGGLVFLRDPKIGPPSGLRAFGGPDSILLQWEPDRQTRVRGYYVYRGATVTGTFARLTEDAVALPEYRDAAAPAGATSYYCVTAVSAAYLPGNTLPRMAESPPSDVVFVAPRSVVLWMPDYAGRRGDWAVLQVNVENADGLSGNGLDIRIAYDPAVIRPAAQVDATNATVHQTPLSESFALADNGASATGLLQITGSGGAAAAGEGRLLNVVFGINTGAVLGAQTTNVIVLAALRNSGGQALAVDFADAAVLTVATGYFLGDVDGDGDLDMDDHQRLMDLLKKNSPPPTPEELYAGDINGNGELDQGDIPLLNRLIHGLPIYPDN